MTISLKTNKYQGTHNETLKNISATFKKEWPTSYDYKKQKPLYYQSQKAPGQLFIAQTIKPIIRI
ncbi:hypothetical protein COL57_10755 [Bacillus wiedmannii]|nr:hypothetical protein COL57_10755 [Bacillus wiedmannii]